MSVAEEDREAGEHDMFGMDSRMEQATKEVPNDLIEVVWVDHGDFGWGVPLLVQYEMG